MGFYIRKSISFGPLRLNLSKSGIGVSVGVKGARISTGPRGTYVHMGRHGVYYRQRIDSPHPQYEEDIDSIKPSEKITTTDVSKLVESSNEEILSDINSRLKQIAFAPFAVGVTFTLVLLCFFLSDISITLAQITAGFVSVVGFVLSWFIHRGDQVKRTTPLFYELEDEAKNRFDAIQNAGKNLAQARRIWYIRTKQENWDWKRNAGAASLVTRKPVSIGKLNPVYIATNVEVYGFDLDDMKLMFFPDHVFVYQQGRYGAVSYDSLNVEFKPTRFIEDESVPQDAEVVDSTWQYVRRDGGPDRRFSNNRQIPIVLYGLLEITSPTGLNIVLHISNKSLARQFSDVFNHIRNQSFFEQPFQEEDSKEEFGLTEEFNIAPAYEILGLKHGASLKEVKTAYHRMAQMYHPDKVASLAPEFRELAENRMKEINAAYEELKKRLN